jgi:MFS family permease
MVFAAILAASTAAEVYAKPFLGALGDYFPRLRLVAWTQGVAVVLSMLVLMLSLRDGFNATHLTVLLVGAAICAAIRDPVGASLIPSLVRPDQITAAVARRSGINSSMMLAAPVLAAAVVAAAGISVAISLACVATAASCLLFVVCDRRAKLESGAVSLQEFLGSWASRTWGGFVAVHRTRAEFQLALVAAVVNVVMFPFFTVVVPVWVKLQLNGPATYIGIFDGAFGAGLVVGSLGIVGWVSRKLGRFRAVFIGFAWLGVALFSLSWIDSFAVCTAIGATMGTAFVLINVNTGAVRSAATPADYRSRMNAIVTFLSTVVNPMGVWLAGLALTAWGVPTVLAVGGAVALAMAPVVAMLRASRRALSLRDEELPGYYKKTYPHAFQ